MSSSRRRYRFLLGRRACQGLVLLLLIGANLWGWRLLAGNLSMSRLLGTVPLADPFAVLQMTLAGAIPAREVLLGAAITLLFYAVLAGRAFCAWVCPVNLVTDLANWLRRRLFPDGGGEWVLVRRTARFKILLLSLVLSAVLGVAAFEWISPISMLHRGLILGMGIGWTAVLAVFLFDLLCQHNGFCGHLCPLGAFYVLLTRFARLRVEHDRERCTECAECKSVCPESQILHQIGVESGHILAGECTNCGRCVEVCEYDALALAFRKVSR